MKEIWKDIKGYEGKYQISNLGRLKTIRFKKWYIMKFHLDKHNYCDVCLWKNGKKKHSCIHKLVAQYFVDNPNNYNAVIHKDKNFSNNIYTNLEWVPVEETYFKSKNKPEYNGKKYNTIKDFYKFYCNNFDTENKLNYNTFRTRLYRGWNEIETLLIPYKTLQNYNHKFKKYYYKGKTKTLKQLYELSKNKINYKTLCTRLCRQWSAEEAIEIPVQQKGR